MQQLFDELNAKHCKWISENVMHHDAKTIDVLMRNLFELNFSCLAACVIDEEEIDDYLCYIKDQIIVKINELKTNNLVKTQ